MYTKIYHVLCIGDRSYRVTNVQSLTDRAEDIPDARC